MFLRLRPFVSVELIPVAAFVIALLAIAAPAAWAAAPEPVSPHLTAADLEAGKRAARKCRACHSLDRKAAVRLGPPLWNVVNRPKASVSGFKYSSSLEMLGGVWDYEALNAFIAAPSAVAPKNRMRFDGIDSIAERAALIVYLRSLSDSPAPLPEGAPRPAAVPATEEKQDFGELPPGPGREDVFFLCGACHSLRLVYQQGLSRDSWDEIIESMVKRQGMPELDPAERERVVDYLATHYGVPKGRQPMAPMSAPPPPPPPN